MLQIVTYFAVMRKNMVVVQYSNTHWDFLCRPSWNAGGCVILTQVTSATWSPELTVLMISTGQVDAMLVVVSDQY